MCHMNKTTYRKEFTIMDKIQLNEAESTLFCNALKRGIYKELYHRNLLTDVQLNELLEKNK